MKNIKYILILLTCVFIAFTLGLFLGRSNYDGSITALVEQKAASAGKVDLNTGTLDEFCMIPGISEITAQKIIDYREENGPFESVDELCEVSGISEVKLEELRRFLKVGG